MLFLLALADRPDDADFLEEIYHSHYRLLYGQALRVLRHREDAEDVVQAAMLKLTKKIHILRGLECNKLASYLVITVRNTAINLYHKRKVHLERQAAMPLAIIPGDMQEGPEAQALSRDGVEEVKVGYSFKGNLISFHEMMRKADRAPVIVNRAIIINNCVQFLFFHLTPMIGIYRMCEMCDQTPCRIRDPEP